MAVIMKGVYRAVDAVLSLVDGDLVVPSVDNHGNLRVAVTGATDRTATGTLTASQGNTPTVATSAVEINCQGCGTVGVDIRGTFNETILFEASVDGTNFEPVEAIAPVGGTIITSVVNNGAYSEILTVASAGYALVRVRCSVFASGSASIVLEASSAGQDVTLANALPVGDNLVGRVKLSDGTNVETVKAASTAAAFADTAAVTDIRPGGIFPAAVSTQVDAVTNATSLTKIVSWLMAFNGTSWDRVKSMQTGALPSMTTGILNTLGVLKFNAVKPALLDGELTELQGSSRGALLVANDEIPQAQDDANQVIATVIKPLATSTYAWSVAFSVALEASKIVKASPGNLRAATIRLDATAPSATYYVQVLNSASLPADGPVVHLIAPIKKIHTTGTDTYISVDMTDSCINATAGIVVVLSITEFTKTISGAYLSNTILYK